jgi:hypothetical protein
MISSGELYDLADEVLRTGSLTSQEQTDLIEECHRLRHLVEEMADFRSSKQHQETIEALRVIREDINK